MLIGALLRVFDESMMMAQPPVQYWLASGTALGAVRNSGLIPHDLDADVKVPKEYLYNDRVYDVLRRHVDRFYPGLFAVVKLGSQDWKKFSESLPMTTERTENLDPWYTAGAVQLGHSLMVRLLPRAQKGTCIRDDLLREGLCLPQLDVFREENAKQEVINHGGLCKVIFNGRPLISLVDAPKYLLKRYGSTWSTPDKEHNSQTHADLFSCAGWEAAWLANERRLLRSASVEYGTRDTKDEVESGDWFSSRRLRDCETSKNPWLHVREEHWWWLNDVRR